MQAGWSLKDPPAEQGFGRKAISNWDMEAGSVQLAGITLPQIHSTIFPRVRLPTLLFLAQEINDARTFITPGVADLLHATSSVSSLSSYFTGALLVGTRRAGDGAEGGGEGGGGSVPREGRIPTRAASTVHRCDTRTRKPTLVRTRTRVERSGRHEKPIGGELIASPALPSPTGAAGWLPELESGPGAGCCDRIGGRRVRVPQPCNDTNTGPAPVAFPPTALVKVAAASAVGSVALRPKELISPEHFLAGVFAYNAYELSNIRYNDKIINYSGFNTVMQVGHNDPRPLRVSVYEVRTWCLMPAVKDEATPLGQSRRKVINTASSPYEPHALLRVVADEPYEWHRDARPRSRSEGAIRATLTRTFSASSLLRPRRAVFPSSQTLHKSSDSVQILYDRTRTRRLARHRQGGSCPVLRHVSGDGRQKQGSSTDPLTPDEAHFLLSEATSDPLLFPPLSRIPRCTSASLPSASVCLSPAREHQLSFHYDLFSQAASRTSAPAMYQTRVSPQDAFRIPGLALPANAYALRKDLSSHWWLEGIKIQPGSPRWEGTEEKRTLCASQFLARSRRPPVAQSAIDMGRGGSGFEESRARSQAASVEHDPRYKSAGNTRSRPDRQVNTSDTVGSPVRGAWKKKGGGGDEPGYWRELVYPTPPPPGYVGEAKNLCLLGSRPLERWRSRGGPTRLLELFVLHAVASSPYWASPRGLQTAAAPRATLARTAGASSPLRLRTGEQCAFTGAARQFDSRRGRPWIFARGDRCRAMPLIAGFLGDLPFPPPLHSAVVTYSPRFTLTGLQDLDVKSRPNLFTPWNRRHRACVIGASPLSREWPQYIPFLTAPLWLLLRAASVYSTEQAPDYHATLHHTPLLVRKRFVSVLQPIIHNVQCMARGLDRVTVECHRSCNWQPHIRPRGALMHLLVYATRVEHVDTLRDRIAAGCETIRNTPEIHQHIRESMQRWVEACVTAGGGHLEHSL
ncbi:hypothetical protein PR048_016909 [Dryococelus australis]|uniref:Uncharacterized protein n=1 Tax=Dryococelus australis TaxID=614101 RepID=A0ABQ9H807_9NEOP|nr:hypothetical protein PR048_016909 [Dryococelus australis]